MRPRILIPAIATAMTAAALLNGCSTNAQPSATINGAGGAPTAAAPASSASTIPVAGLNMTFSIPADLTLQFATAPQSSTTANQIETILVDQYKGYIEALSSAGATETNFRYLTVADARSSENSQLAWWKQHDERLTGVDKLYDFTVGSTNSGNYVTFSYCEDSTGVAYKNLSTGQAVSNTYSSTANHTLHAGDLIKGQGQLWAVSTVLTQGGAQQCMNG